MKPVVSYARSNGVHIAYATFGEGDLDIVVVPGFVSTLDLTMESHIAPLVERCSRLGRVVVFDKRGTGLSDRVPDMPNLDTRMDDLRAVMDAVDADRAHILGVSEGGPLAVLFAASFPARTRTLGLYGSFASFVRTHDHPFMPTVADRERVLRRTPEFWGAGALATFFPEDELTSATRELIARYETRSASPGAVINLVRMNCSIDVRAILGSVTVPTLVVHPIGDRVIPFEAGQYLAAHIPGARFVPFDLDNHLTLRADRARAWLDEYEEFITGTRPPGTVGDRVLTTVLFTDIVGSTEQAAELGDAAWRQLLDRHDEIVRRELVRFRGDQVKHTGDGVLARFDGPARAVSCGLAISEAVHAIGIDVRTGVHTGEIEVRANDIGGIAVHVGARVMALAEPSEVLVTRTVRDLTAGSGLVFADRGEHTLKGVPDRWQLFQADA